MQCNRFTCLLAAIGLLLVACGQETVQVGGGASAPRAVVSSQPSIVIQPSRPVAGDCLGVVLPGQSARSADRWEVNGQQVSAGPSGELCNGFRRGDRVSVKVGETSATVVIANSPPQVTGISAIPEQLHAGMDVEVFPVAEDRDSDPVEFRYQWLINGEANPFMTEAKLPGESFRRGDRLQVSITPFDGRDAGPVYHSYVMPVPNAPPRVTSAPPPEFEALEYRYQVLASDPDGDPLSFSLSNTPPGMTISPAGLVSWPLAGVREGVYPVKLVVNDPEGAETSQEFTLTLGSPRPPAAQKP